MNKRLILVVITILCCTVSVLGAGRRSMDDRIIEKASTCIAKFEGFRDYVYTCPGGKKTIGYGFTDRLLIEKGTITKAEADKRLRELCRLHLKYIRPLVTRKLTEDQMAALISFTYNVGQGNFARSTLLRKINAGADASEIRSELMKWVHVNKQVVNGLVNRRNYEAKMWLS